MPSSAEENGRRPATDSQVDPDAVLTGWHFWLVVLALGNFGKSNWIVIAYLLTYTGFLIIFARLSDIFGRKLALLSALTLFTVFSLACGVAQTMEQLIVFRAFQGIGGSGIYGMVMAIAPEITPAAKFGLVSGCISAVFASSSILGPIIGGAITSTTTWRWVFYLKSGFLTGFPFMVTIIFLPQRFQIENDLSPVDAGVKMLALLLLSAFGAGLAGFICSKKNISWYLLVLSNVLQVIGLGLLSSIPSSETVLARQYGYQVILGLGFGLGLSSLVIVSRVEVDDADLGM
ncbi:MAG: hypothetical protein Q9203_002967 [Teloschistes exilis]